MILCHSFGRKLSSGVCSTRSACPKVCSSTCAHAHTASRVRAYTGTRTPPRRSGPQTDTPRVNSPHVLASMAHTCSLHVLTHSHTLAHSLAHPPPPNVYCSATHMESQALSLSLSRAHPGPYFCPQPSSLLSPYLSNFRGGPILRCPKLNSRFPSRVCCFLIFPSSGNGAPSIRILEVQCSESCLAPLSSPPCGTQVQWVPPSQSKEPGHLSHSSSDGQRAPCPLHPPFVTQKSDGLQQPPWH